MKHGLKQLPPSRRDKKQIVAHLDPVLVEAVHRRRKRDGITVQEIIGTAVNAAVQKFGRTPFLAVRRDRVVKREKALAQVQKPENAPRCRAGKRRVAAWFDTSSVERVAAFSAEVGTSIEDLVEIGLKEMLWDHEIIQARDAMESEAAQAA